MKTKAPGLTLSGRSFVENVGLAGGLVDVSHASDAATDEILELALQTGQIIIATHSNARGLAPHPRNLTDAQIRKISQSGGVIGVNFHQSFLTKRRGAGANLKDLVEQILYIKRLGGIESVALGSDFEGGISAIPELSDATRYQRLAEALRAVGMDEPAIRKVFHQNALRVLCAKSPPVVH